MYKGKHVARHSRKGYIKTLILQASLIMILLATVGTSLAFLFTRKNEITNTFVPVEITTKVLETESGGQKTNVKIKNTGGTDAYIRAQVVITWQNADGDVWGVNPVEGTDYQISWTKSGWLKASDGLYYYTSPVAPNGATGVLFTNCAPVEGHEPAEGYYLAVEVLGSGIQSDPTYVVEDVWDTGVSRVNTNGTLSIKGGA